MQSEILLLKKQSSSPEETSSLRATVTALQLELNDREQMDLSCSLEVSGVPEMPGESVTHIITTLGSKIGFIVKPEDVVSINRVGPVRRDAVARAEGASGSRPRLIAIRFARRALRDDMLRAARVRRNITTSDLDPAPHIVSRIFINECLTKTNRVLFAKARKAGAASKWKYVWTKDGRIYARESDTPGARAHRLRTEQDLCVFPRLTESPAK